MTGPSVLPAWMSRWLVASSITLFAAAASPFTFEPAPQPDLDLSQLGRVALAGDFDAISLYEYIGQGQNKGSTNGSHAVFSRFPNGLFHALTSADGNIQSICPYEKNGEFQGFAIGGNFTSLGGKEASGLAIYDPETDSVTPVTGLSGRVDALLCEKDTIYVGGTFTEGDSKNAMVWSDGWEQLPFKGFNGPVKSITKSESGSLVFAGSFTGLGTTKKRQATDDIDENIIREVPLAAANVYTITDRSSYTGNSDPKNLFCTDGKSDMDGSVWFGPDNGPASLQAEFNFMFTPVKLRLWNTDLHNHGTKTWRFTAFPINGIMNFTYVDDDGKQQHCDAWCPLPQGSGDYRDFYFVNNVGMNTYRLDLNEWYGEGPGLSGLQLYIDQGYEYAIDNFNAPSCDGSTSNGASRSNTAGNWEHSPPGISSSQYLMTTVDAERMNPDDLSVTITPAIKESGNYTILMYTPGCINDGTCSNRGRVTVTAKFSQSEEPQVAEVWQTNNYEKYDQLFFTYLETSDNFQPTITIKPSPGQTGMRTFVAQSLRLDLVSVTSGVNGLFEYDASKEWSAADITKSEINKSGRALDRGAQVNTVVSGDGMYIAGNFTGTGIKNIAGIDAMPFELSNGGVDHEVNSMYRDGDFLYIGGSFTKTADKSIALQHVARYNVKENTWAPLLGGVDGVVQYIVPISITIPDSDITSGIAISGKFGKLFKFEDKPEVEVDSIAIWVPELSDWLVNVDNQMPALGGRLTAVSSTPNGDAIFAGDVSSQAISANGAVGLREGEKMRVEKLPFTIGKSKDVKKTSTEEENGKSKRELSTDVEDLNGVVTGLMYTEDALNITIFGGHFTAKDSDDNDIYNVLFVNGTDGDRVRGLPEGLEESSVVTSLDTHSTLLYIGGKLSGEIDGEKARGMVVYDLRSHAFASVQPQPLTGNGGVVHAISSRPEGSEVFVAGSFTGAGSFNCPALCVFNTERSQWQNPSGNLEGTVYALSWIDQNRLLVAGDFTVQGKKTNIQVYDMSQRDFTDLPGGSAPGTIKSLTPGNEDSSQLFVAGETSEGETFIAKHDGTKWITVEGFDASTTQVKGLQVFSLKNNHDKNDFFEENRSLLILGSVDLPEVGPVSGAVYNGDTFTPFALTSSSSSGRTGSLSSAFVQNPHNFFTNKKKKLAVGLVVLIGLAISLALTSLIILAGLFLNRHRRGVTSASQQEVPEQVVRGINAYPPTAMFHNI